MYSRERRSPLYLATGLIIGVVIGLVFGWIILPVEAIDLAPDVLREDFKIEYRELISLAYLANGDIGRARSRLDLLGEGNQARTLEIQAQEAMGRFAQEHIARAIGLLAENLKISQDEIQTFILTEKSPEDNQIAQTATPEQISEINETPSPTATGVFLPTSTSNPIDSPMQQSTNVEDNVKKYLISKQEVLCENQNGVQNLQIYVLDNGVQIPWIEIEIEWENGFNRIYTGFKPDIGNGFADFVMQEQVLYNVKLGELSEPLIGISWAECIGSDGTKWWGGWEINFSND